MSENNLINPESSPIIIESPEYPKYFKEITWQYNWQKSDTYAVLQDVHDYVYWNGAGQEITSKRIYFADAGFHQGGDKDGQPYVDNKTFPDFAKTTCDALVFDTIKRKLGKVKLGAMRFFVATYPLTVDDVFPKETGETK